ncbi:MAG: HIT domain-containing protein [Thermoanaerobaculum sp.]|nr:HIT domain-containing protein [Thermoanaerobaculum sp.]MDW7966580.1 HIT domain-containing protein [Thermoanaerobaculum sp.]
MSLGKLAHLFAPWRFTYLAQAGETSGTCIFCTAVGGQRDTLTVAVGERVFALLNRYPYTAGHVMVAPKAHVGEFTALDRQTLAELMEMAQAMVKALDRVYQPHGYNLGFNLGEAAGAGIVDHLHLHVVPRFRGDTNFMTTNAAVRVVPEALEQTWSKLRAALEGMDVKP